MVYIPASFLNRKGRGSHGVGRPFEDTGTFGITGGKHGRTHGRRIVFPSAAVMVIS